MRLIDADKLIELSTRLDLYGMVEISDINEMPTVYDIDEVVKALEKQTPKKPIYQHYEEKGEKPYIKTVCPNGCNFRLNARYDKYCHICGQRIDWSEGE